MQQPTSGEPRTVVAPFTSQIFIVTRTLSAGTTIEPERESRDTMIRGRKERKAGKSALQQLATPPKNYDKERFQVTSRGLSNSIQIRRVILESVGTGPSDIPPVYLLVPS